MTLKHLMVRLQFWSFMEYFFIAITPRSTLTLTGSICLGPVTMHGSQMKIPAEREQDFVWCVEQRNKKAYLKFDVRENRKNVE